MKKFLIPLIASAGLLLAATTAFAATPLSGYAWSSNIGWLSFNLSDGSTVQLATTTGSSIGTLSGYAWSPNIGWVSFEPEDTANCPADAGAANINGCTPSVNMTSGAVSGWARAVRGEDVDTLIGGTGGVAGTPGQSWIAWYYSDNDGIYLTPSPAPSYTYAGQTFYVYDLVKWFDGTSAQFLADPVAAIASAETIPVGSTRNPTTRWIFNTAQLASEDSATQASTIQNLSSSVANRYLCTQNIVDAGTCHWNNAGVWQPGISYSPQGTIYSGLHDSGSGISMTPYTTLGTFNDGTGVAGTPGIGGYSATGGWDGWIELSGGNHPTVPNLSAISNTATSTQGISLNTSNNQLSGYAWGSDVVGWLSFNNGSNTNGTNSPVCLGTTCNPPPPSQSPIIVSACNISNRPTNPVNSGYQLTVNSTNGNVTASGGNNGSYTYLWSNDNISFSPQPTTLTFTNTSSSIVPETIFVEAQDSSGTSASHQCGTVAVNGTSVNNNGSVSLGVWPNSLVPSGTIPTLTQLTNMQPTTVHTGSSVTLDYTYPSSNGTTCLGEVYPPTPSGWHPASWYQASLGLNPNSIGSVNFINMTDGVYKLYMSCSTPSTRANFLMAIIDNLLGKQVQAAAPTISNTVEIDVVSSSIHEN